MTMTELKQKSTEKVIEMDTLCDIVMTEENSGWFNIYKYQGYDKELVRVRAYPEREKADAAYSALTS